MQILCILCLNKQENIAMKRNVTKHSFAILTVIILRTVTILLGSDPSPDSGTAHGKVKYNLHAKAAPQQPG